MAGSSFQATEPSDEGGLLLECRAAPLVPTAGARLPPRNSKRTLQTCVSVSSLPADSVLCVLPGVEGCRASSALQRRFDTAPVRR